MEFTDEQVKAIDITRLGEDACIVAGPGSGKTTVLVERYRQLIAAGIQPSEILAITFTEKAAANMRHRLAAEFAGDAEMLRKLERAQVSTIHGFCSRLLKENATAAGVDPEFEILDEQVAVLEQAKALRRALDDAFREHPAEGSALLEATMGSDLEQMIPGIYDAMRAAGKRPVDLRRYAKPKAPGLERILSVAKRYINGFPTNPNAKQREAREQTQEWLTRLQAVRNPRDLFLTLCQKGFNLRLTNSAKDLVKEMQENELIPLRVSLLDDMYAGEKDLLIRIFEDFDANYRHSKSDLATLDFNDLEYFAVRMLEENPEIRQQVNDQYRLVMIDEFQDTSAQQASLVALVRAPGRFYAVGDLNQSIYSFRHANPEVFNGHRRSVEASGAHLQELVENWRSREPVLLATQLILNQASGIAPRDLVPARQLPPREEPCIEVLILERNDEDDFTLEAEWVVHRVLDLLGSLRIGELRRAAKLSDFAILVRNTNALQPFLDAFTAAGLDYNLNRRTGFFETREARDLLHLLRMIENPRDETSTLVTLRSAFAGISDEGLLRLKLHHRNFGDALAYPDRVTLDPEDRSRFDRFVAAFSGWRSAAAQIPIDRLLLRALDEMGIVWRPQSIGGANIEKFLTIARSYSQMTLREFLTHVDSMRTTDPRETDSPIDETRDAVQIMSTHAAKGLEFPVVILATMDKGVDGARSPALNFTPQFGLGVKWKCPDGEEAESGQIHFINKKLIKTTEEEEANRLLYVALTRAQEHLILSWGQKVGKPAANWARTVSAALDLNGIAPGDGPQFQQHQAPNGKRFDLRLVCSAVPPPLFAHIAPDLARSELLVIDRPILTGQFELNATATALSQFASCPRKYYLGTYLGWKADLVRPRASGGKPGSSLRASEIGTQVHSLLAGIPVEQPDLEAIRLATVFERSPYGKRADRARRREREWDFVFAFDRLILGGTIDLWFEDAQGLTLIDYKTNDIRAQEAGELSRDYALQLQVYALALERALGKRPGQALLHFLRPDAVISVPIGDADEELTRVAREFTQAQENIDFPLNAGPHCRHCEFFRNICPAKIQSVDLPPSLM